MNIEEFVLRVNMINWEDYNGPECYDASKVPLALEAATRADTILNVGIVMDKKAYDDLLSALGNNHCGTYYPCMLKALDFVIELALYGNYVATRNCALNALVDIYCSFDPEVGTYKMSAEELASYVRTAIKEHKKDFIQLQNSDSHNKALISDLVETIDLQPNFRFGMNE